MIDFERILQWRCWWKQYIKDKNHGSFPLQEEKREPIHVLMNGPSRAATINYLEKIPGKVMMVNQALVASVEIQPDYYCLADGVYRTDATRQVEGQESAVRKLYKVFEEYEKPLVIFTPNELRNDIGVSNPNISFQGVCCSHCPKYHGGGIVKHILQKNMGCPRPQGVVILALYVSIQMGYKEIYLHGADQNELSGISVNTYNQKIYQSKHYYDKDTNKIHIEPGTMLDEYEAQMYLYQSFYGIEKYAKDCGVKIINMSNDSLVDCFEKIGSYEIEKGIGTGTEGNFGG